MNVAFDPWIPVVDLQGKPERISIVSLFTKGEKFADLAVRPHERVSLMRLFLCIAHAALDGPKDYEEWLQVPTKLPNAAERYLTQWKDSFELFHKTKPWLQVADLQETTKKEDKASPKDKTSPVVLLDFEIASGKNSTLFEHLAESESREVKLERLALNLLTYQNFSSGGGLPIAQWDSVVTKQVGNLDAPCLSQSMTHSLFRGNDLLCTIYLNLPSYESIQETYISFNKAKKKDQNVYNSISLGKPIWENFPTSPKPDSEEAVNATKTYLGRLVPISRWVKLLPNFRMYCCAGFKYDKYEDGFPAEPTASVKIITRQEEQKREVVKAAPSKALWRELSSLLVHRTSEGIGGPIAMSNAPRDEAFDFMVCAITRDQASMDIAMESVFHIKPALVSHNSIHKTEIGGGKNTIGAEGYAIKLRTAIEVYRKEVDWDWERRVEKAGKEKNVLKDKLAEKALLYYWTNVEKSLSLLMMHIEAIGTDQAEPTRNVWRKAIFQIACDAYRSACAKETPRQVKAFVKGWRKLVTNDQQAVSRDDELSYEEEVIA
ncbi:type I-E CRISPR-associated protein Cse1/CasA [Leptospira sp. WS92.C1]